MPHYRLTIDALRWAPGAYTSPEAGRVFDVYVQAPTAAAARAYFRAARPGKAGVTDPRDGAWFDTWVITRTAKTPVFDVVMIMGPSARVVGETRFYAKRPANVCLRNTRARCKPGQSAFIRTGV
jgi:hypothetical protein